MDGQSLRDARKSAGWTQARLARHLGVTQAYLSLMERGKRRVSQRIARKAAGLLGLPETALPQSPPHVIEMQASSPQVDDLVHQGLVNLRYPGFAYRPVKGVQPNPMEILLLGLAAEELDARLVEALPWLLLHYEGIDLEDLVLRARALNVQNRLGFTTALARQVARRNRKYLHRQQELRSLEDALEPYRLAREDFLGRQARTAGMRRWVRENRSAAARHWNILTGLKVESLFYAERSSGDPADLPEVYRPDS